MNERIERRVLKAAEHIALTGATVRQAARLLGVSKSTVHKDMEKRLEELSPALYREVMQVFAVNKKSEKDLFGRYQYKFYREEELEWLKK